MATAPAKRTICTRDQGVMLVTNACAASVAATREGFNTAEQTTWIRFTNITNTVNCCHGVTYIMVQLNKV